MSKSIGDMAEQIAADHLEQLAYEIIDRNWKTPHCEIDIIAKNNEAIYFFEVKYRSSNLYGSGIDFITRSKLKQMHYAAELWCHEYAYEGSYELAAIEVMGKENKVQIIEQLI